MVAPTPPDDDEAAPPPPPKPSAANALPVHNEYEEPDVAIPEAASVQPQAALGQADPPGAAAAGIPQTPQRGAAVTSLNGDGFSTPQPQRQGGQRDSRLVNGAIAGGAALAGVAATAAAAGAAAAGPAAADPQYQSPSGMSAADSPASFRIRRAGLQGLRLLSSAQIPPCPQSQHCAA
jgi:hypothetical protein